MLATARTRATGTPGVASARRSMSASVTALSTALTRSYARACASASVSAGAPPSASNGCTSASAGVAGNVSSVPAARLPAAPPPARHAANSTKPEGSIAPRSPLPDTISPVSGVKPNTRSCGPARSQSATACQSISTWPAPSSRRSATLPGTTGASRSGNTAPAWPRAVPIERSARDNACSAPTALRLACASRGGHSKRPETMRQRMKHCGPGPPGWWPVGAVKRTKPLRLAARVSSTTSASGCHAPPPEQNSHTVRTR